MFNLAKKKQEEEHRIVDHIIQTYAEEGEATQKLRCFIDRMKNRNERDELLESLECHDRQLCENPIFGSFKKRLFGKAGGECVLTHLELSVCFLLSTQKYYPEVIADMLWIDGERLREVVQSLEAKLAAGGYRLPKGYKAMQPAIYEYCG